MPGARARVHGRHSRPALLRPRPDAARPAGPPLRSKTQKERTLDVICTHMGDFELWFWGVQVVLNYPPQAWNAQLQQRADNLDTLRQSHQQVPIHGLPTARGNRPTIMWASADSAASDMASSTVSISTSAMEQSTHAGDEPARTAMGKSTPKGPCESWVRGKSTPRGLVSPGSGPTA